MLFPSPNIFIVVAFNLTLYFKSIFGLHFDTAGFHNCIFNLVVHNPRYEIFSRDLTEFILVKNQRNQRWTVTLLDPNASSIYQDFGESSSGYPSYLKETCSVNLFVAIGCYTGSVYHVFGSLVAIPENILIIIQGKWNECSDAGNLNKVYVEYLYVIQLWKNLRVFSIFSLCGTCFSNSKMHEFRTPRTLKVFSFQHLKEISSGIKRSSLTPVIALIDETAKNPSVDNVAKRFKFLLRNLDEIRIRDTVHSPNKIIMEITADHFNLSLEVYNLQTARRYSYFLTGKGKHFSAVVLPESTSSKDTFTDVYPHSLLSTLDLKDEPSNFVYCVKFVERERFSLLFWTVPLDTWTWTLLGISCVFLTIQLHGHWFEIYSILMRQSCTILEKNRVLIIEGLRARSTLGILFT